jgi:hypothetical protein
MAWQFQKHYTRDEARDLLPGLRQDLQRLNVLRKEVTHQEQQIASLLNPGHDAGGKAVNDCVKNLGEMKRLLLDFHRRQIQIKDLERGLIDFPAIIGQRGRFIGWLESSADRTLPHLNPDRSPCR